MASSDREQDRPLLGSGGDGNVRPDIHHPEDLPDRPAPTGGDAPQRSGSGTTPKPRPRTNWWV